VQVYGFFNKLLRVDLAAQRWAREPIADDTLAQYLGGGGLGARLLLEFGRRVPILWPLRARSF
jgi:aldehyde:ferredoxin oxidoreductase